MPLPDAFADGELADVRVVVWIPDPDGRLGLAWWIDDNGLWATDNDKRPEAVFGDITYRHVLP